MLFHITCVLHHNAELRCNILQFIVIFCSCAELRKMILLYCCSVDSNAIWHHQPPSLLTPAKQTQYKSPDEWCRVIFNIPKSKAFKHWVQLPKRRVQMNSRHVVLLIALYSAILRSRADSLRSHVIQHEWLAFYSAFLNIHRSGVLTALAWLVPHETAAISARSVYTIQPCTMSLHAKPHT